MRKILQLSRCAEGLFRWLRVIKVLIPRLVWVCNRLRHALGNHLIMREQERAARVLAAPAAQANASGEVQQ